MELKKGYYFSLDALLASVLLVGGLLLISQFNVYERNTEQIDYLSKDFLMSLSELKMYELNNSNVTELLGPALKPNISVLEQIGELWATNQTSLAVTLTELLVDSLVPELYGFRVDLGQDTLYQKNISPTTDLVISRRMITGIEKGQPLTGATGSGYLRKISDKKTSSYVYFGGFVGQGNITVQVEDIPQDVEPEDITGITLEADVESSFDLYINQDYCDSLTPSTSNMTADAWDITHCNSSITPGTNNFSIIFLSDMGTSYVGGGFIKVSYKTDEFQQGINYGSRKYWFPAIDGIINLYDSFYTPGTLKNMTIYLHYLANHPAGSNNSLSLVVGNTTVYFDTNSTTEQYITLNDSYLSSLLNYSKLSLTTVPLRFGFLNLSVIGSSFGEADVVVITDLSGSMTKGIDGGSGVPRNCDDPNYNQSDTTKMSVAKCVDKMFAEQVLSSDASGSLVGLTAYGGYVETDWDVYPTSNYSLINETVGTAVPETGYTKIGGGTCICCGINSARDMLGSNLRVTTYISNVSSGWLWLANNLSSSPPKDSYGNNWYDTTYLLESDWKNGSSVFGSGAGTVPINTVLPSTPGIVLSPTLWENEPDSNTSYVEFDAGLNYTGNTWGESNGVGDDGWDSLYGAFGGNGNDVTINFDPDEDGNQDDNTVLSDTRIEIFIGEGYDTDDPPQDEYPSDDGAVGIELYIDQAMWDKLQSNGTALLTFDWMFDPSGINDDKKEGAWIKAQFGTSSNMTYLGSDLDSNGKIKDSTKEIYWCQTKEKSNSCPEIISGTYQEDISSLITGPGWYYLVLGGIGSEDSKDKDEQWDTTFRFYFDNVGIDIQNETEYFFFRKKFTINNLSDIQTGVLNVVSDDKATVYINGNVVDEDLTPNTASFWNRAGININQDLFVLGENVLAAKLTNAMGPSRFAVELKGLNTTRARSMIMMSDGKADRDCSSEQGTGDSKQDAILAACQAAAAYGIIIHSVAFGADADPVTLQAIADCGNGLFNQGNNIDELVELYSDLATTIINAVKRSQTFVLEGDYLPSTLYPDSFIDINYTPLISQPVPNEISLVLETPKFNSCNASVYLWPDLRIVDSHVTSYSGEHWTDLVVVNNEVAFNLSEFNTDYSHLGDPFIVQIPTNLLNPGINQLFINTGDNPNMSTNCSTNNSMIYTAFLNSSTARSDVLPDSEGCRWLVEFSDYTTTNINTPPEYSGSNQCNFTNATGAIYNDQDAYDVAMHSLLSQLDFDDDYRVDVNLEQFDLEIVISLVTEVPYLWGPSIFEVKIWQ
jgi:hypothetical protein